MTTKTNTAAKTHTPAPSNSDTFNLAGLAEAIHNGTGATGRQLTQDTLAAAAALAYAFGKNEAGDYFAARAKSYGVVLPGPTPARYTHCAAAVLTKHKAIFGD